MPPASRILLKKDDILANSPSQSRVWERNHSVAIDTTHHVREKCACAYIYVRT